jgi:hypothetical protein
LVRQASNISCLSYHDGGEVLIDLQKAQPRQQVDVYSRQPVRHHLDCGSSAEPFGTQLGNWGGARNQVKQHAILLFGATGRSSLGLCNRS